MTISQTLLYITEIFTKNKVKDAHFEARVLLGYLLKLSPVQIYREPESCLTQDQKQELLYLIDRRIQGEPAAYIVNRREFYGLDFFVDSRVLIPRPETELLVETAIYFIKNHDRYFGNVNTAISVADIGTGCGNISISLAKNIDNIRIFATDISTEALDVALHNSHYHNVTEKIIFLQGNLLEPITKPLDLIIANLPYIRTAELPFLDTEISGFEPMTALDGGENGLSKIDELLGQIQGRTSNKCQLLLEIGSGQKDQLDISLGKFLPSSCIHYLPDLNGIVRVATIDIIN
jgi:release factor glutamine methyltransferase